MHCIPVHFLYEFYNSCFQSELNFKKALPSGEANLLHITGITQDANGVMWFSTKKGSL
jgi:hypothetical protein